ncbi:transglycosylase domain-containing protein [Streptomyces sp. NWU49]|uniref:transglycosylase domain-containing protein n=1 Tax=Streptomyces sp. NWU49 TaxID=2201153 RepID=UPI0015E81302|nr:transglycosylase domain-containing protein [Streptomyces sp. NWU49]
MQLQVPPPPVAADETMQLRVPEGGIPDGGIPDGSGMSAASAEPAASDTPSAASGAPSRRRRKAPRPSPAARLAAAFRSRLAPVLGPVVAWLGPHARRLRPHYPRPGRTGWRRWIPSWRQTLGGFLASFGLSTLFLVVAYAATDIPDNLNTYATQQDNVYFWADGTPMARTGWVQRQAMPLEDIPKHVRSAVLAAENASFYSDPGISFEGLTRALFRTLGQGETQGGSTITQQYVKNVYLNQDQTLSRKFEEAMIALKLDNEMSKDEILEGYLNTSWYGRGTYGIQRAAQAYYGKDVSKLNASESAFLASLLKGAGLFDPTLGAANRERAVERWSWTLDRMVEIGELSPQERAKYRTFPEPLKSNPLYDTGEQSDYLVELVAQYAKKNAGISDREFDLGGYEIHTTFDKKRMARLTDAVTKARKKAQKDHPKAARTAHYGAASIAADGRILAVYGGPDHRKQGYNESNATTVPAGSAFMPFVYAAGLEHGVRKTRDGERTPVTGETVYNGDDEVPVTTPEGPYWDRGGRKVSARNDGGKSYGQISLRRALALSVNTPFMQLGMDTGLDKVRATAVAAGLLPSSIGARVPALSTGSSTPSAIRMAGGYATFAADGLHTEPYSVRRITHNGHKVALAEPRTRRAMGADTAREVQAALADAFREAHPEDAPATAEVAGKAGTTEDSVAAWYVGTAKKVSTAVVVYRIDLGESLEPLPLEGLDGTAADSVPYGIWSRAMSPLG